MEINLRNIFKKKPFDPDKLVDEKHRRDHRRLDYRYAEDDPFLFIKGDGVWTGVVCATTTDDFDTVEEDLMAVETIEAMHQEISSYFANSKQVEDVQMHILTRYRPSDTDQWREQYLSHVWDPSKLFLSLVENKIAPFLADSTPERREYLLIRLGDFKGKTRPDAVSSLIGTAESVADEMFSPADLAPWRSTAAAIHALLDGYGALPMTRADLSWLIRKTLAGHLPVDDSTSYEASREWRGSYFDMITDYNGHAEGNAVRSQGIDPDTHERVNTYTTTLTVSSTSTVESYVPGTAWGKILRTMDWPVDVSWRVKLLSPKAFKKMIEPKLADVKTESEERFEANAPESATFDTIRDLADQTNYELTNHRPVIMGQLRLSVSAPSLEELDTAELRIRNTMQGIDKNLMVQRRNRIQGLLLEEQLPGDVIIKSALNSQVGISKQTGGVDVDTRLLDLRALAFARLDSSPLVGDSTKMLNGDTIGWYGGPIGYARENGAVIHFDPMTQVARNSGAGIAIIGASGSGKSSLALLLFFWTSESGVQTIVFDPKNDFESFALFLAFGTQINDPDFDQAAHDGTIGRPGSPFQPVNPSWWADTRIASLGGGRSGLLDPFDVTDDYTAGENLARDVLKILITDQEVHTHLAPAWRRMRKYHESGKATHRPTLHELAEHLNASLEEVDSWSDDIESMTVTDKQVSADRRSAIEEAADVLRRTETRDGGRLLFGDPTADVNPFSIGKSRRTIITLFGLTMPGENDDSIADMDDDKRDGMAAAFVVLRAVSKYALGHTRTVYRPSPFTGVSQRPPLAVFLDELKTFTLFPAGRQLLSELLRKGRSLNVVVVAISQQAADLGGIEKSQGDDDDEETNQFGTRFMFLQKSGGEAKDALKMVRNLTGLPSDVVDNLARRLMPGALDTGECVMADDQGRASTIYVDKIFDEITAASETNATIRAKKQDFDPSSNGADWQINTASRDMLRSGVQQKVTKMQGAAIRSLDDYSPQLAEDFRILSEITN
jgi:hypothetical protein